MSAGTFLKNTLGLESWPAAVMDLSGCFAFDALARRSHAMRGESVEHMLQRQPHLLDGVRATQLLAFLA